MPEVNLSLVPEEKGVESLARQIKMAGRAYPLFDIARMILAKPERHLVVFEVKKNPEGQPIQPLFVCALDDTLWLSEDEAIGHILRKHFATFYQTEKTATEPPKGKYTFVAQCGMSGVILGPPNYHDYQNQLRKLHAQRFFRMPFEVFKARVKIVRDEEVVKKWVEEQSWKTEYVCLNMPEPLRLPNMEAVEKHFREVHKENIIKKVERHSLNGAAARSLRSPDLVRLVRNVWEDQRRFPLQIATVLSQQFASHGLQFFKVNKTITHVSVARPHYLDMAVTPVSEGVKRIVDYVNASPRCTRRQLVEALSPTPAMPAAPAASPEAAPAAATPDQPPVAAEQAPAAQVAPAAPAPEPAGPTAEQNAVISDLHWLIHQGHVIEFANGALETAKKPVPKPPKPAAKPAESAAEGASAAEAAAATEAAESSAPAAEASAADVSAEQTPALEHPAESATEPVIGETPPEGEPAQDDVEPPATPENSAGSEPAPVPEEPSERPVSATH